MKISMNRPGGSARPLPRAVLLAAALGLSGCVSVPTGQVQGEVLVCTMDDATPTCARRVADYLGSLAQGSPDAWAFQGRSAVSSGGQGGNVRIEWTRSPPRDVVVLSAPVTRQSWRLELSPEGAVLHGMSGGPRSGRDAQALLRGATGWEIPVEALGDWVRGHHSAHAPAVTSIRFPAAGGVWPVGFDQGGWRIDIVERDAEGRPMRLNAEHAAQGHRVRLVVDQWDAATGG